MLESKKGFKQRQWEEKKAQQETPEAKAAREKAQQEGASGARRKAQQEGARASSHARAAAGNPPPSRFIEPSQFGTIGAKLGAGGLGMALLHHRKKKEARGGKVWGGRKADAALGAASVTSAGWGGLDAVGWGMKRGSDAYRKHKEKDPAVRVRSQQAWDSYRKAKGFTKMGVKTPGDTFDASTNAGKVHIGLHYPKEIPGWSVKRAIALKNHPMFLTGATAAAAAVGARQGWKRKKETVQKDAFGVERGLVHKGIPKGMANLNPAKIVRGAEYVFGRQRSNAMGRLASKEVSAIQRKNPGVPKKYLGDVDPEGTKHVDRLADQGKNAAMAAKNNFDNFHTGRYDRNAAEYHDKSRKGSGVRAKRRKELDNKFMGRRYPMYYRLSSD